MAPGMVNIQAVSGRPATARLGTVRAPGNQKHIDLRSRFFFSAQFFPPGNGTTATSNGVAKLEQAHEYVRQDRALGFSNPHGLELKSFVCGRIELSRDASKLSWLSVYCMPQIVWKLQQHLRLNHVCASVSAFVPVPRFQIKKTRRLHR